MSDVIEPVTTEAHRKRHFAVFGELEPDRRAYQPGRRGRTLCGNYGFDQRRYDAMRASRPWWKALKVTDLPPCKLCDKAMKARAGCG